MIVFMNVFGLMDRYSAQNHTKVRNLKTLHALTFLAFCNVLHIICVPSPFIESMINININMHVFISACAQ